MKRKVTSYETVRNYTNSIPIVLYSSWLKNPLVAGILHVWTLFSYSPAWATYHGSLELFFAPVCQPLAAGINVLTASKSYKLVSCSLILGAHIIPNSTVTNIWRIVILLLVVCHCSCSRFSRRFNHKYNNTQLQNVKFKGVLLGVK